ncbi:MAG: type I methionyl aminopeptidase [Bdellovibrionales bacterium]|nr:type I methionyl aminopeptidase [Bdellovibrionales bacterium]
MTGIPIKSESELVLMRRACQITCEILNAVGPLIQPGLSTEEINLFVHKMTLDLGATPAPLNYKGFPKSVCTSVNDVICHGVPSETVVLKKGDIINVDVTSIYEGFHGDSSRMYFVGGRDSCSQEAQRLVDVTKEALMIGVKEVAPGKHIGDIGAAIEQFVLESGFGYGIVREYTGHGLGREFHEPPQVLHFGRRHTGARMRPGMTFTIEPMLNVGAPYTSLSSEDGWTVRTKDGSLSAQWEHTVLVTDDGYSILTE